MSREMKESALPWVGNIPSNWRLGRIKHIYSVTLGKMISPLQTESEQTLENYLCAANIKWSGVDTSVHKQMWFNKSEKEQYLLEDGDVLIMEGGTVGTTTIYHNEFSPCYIQNSVHKCRGKDMIANKFLYYWMQVVQSSGYIDTVCNKATIQHYTKDKVKETPCILVPEDEQHAIVRYLDAKCAAIDEAIERHKKIIEKLEEYRKASVTKAVTKGIDPTVYKSVDSSWIKEIPVHWDFVPLKSLIHIVDTRNEDPNARLLSLYTAVGVRPRADLEERGNKATTVVGYKNVSEGDIIVNKLLAWMGAVAYSDYDGVTSPDYDIYRHNDGANITRDFYHYYFRYTSFKDDCFVNGHGLMMMRWRTYPYELLRIKVPNPPADEQIKIGRYLRKLNDAIDLSVEKRNGIIIKLEEYRKSIIYNAVTGKIDCKEAVK